MSAIATAESSTAEPDQLRARAEIGRHWGRVPNLGAVLALSLPMTRAVLAFDDALSAGGITGAEAEQLAIAVSHENGCAYCLAAHSAAARAYGVAAEDIAAARTAHASDPKIAAALRFAQQLVRTRGRVDDGHLDAVRAAGWSDADIVELVGHSLSTMLSNYLHHLSKVPIDYPPVEFAEDDSSRV
ncbi:carboxymuconolactone decarboxylase family protein [Mycobacterium sp. UM_CSW]|uniref:carboxymuconolactone decarboxylase family protein n=1 Tax=Mycobacterium sp. UM_CSW TaxID=1370119 RepID=UPI00041C7674|nr:carboxymuconolactone decarboxylase family protein [Mycobacterium sp. UM_CSW]